LKSIGEGGGRHQKLTLQIREMNLNTINRFLFALLFVRPTRICNHSLSSDVEAFVYKHGSLLFRGFTHHHHHHHHSILKRTSLYSFKLQFNLNEISKGGDGNVYIVNEMPPPLPKTLRNSYYMLRHGQSWGNVEGVISSARSLANSTKHGLTPLGYEQAYGSSQELLQFLSDKEENKNKVVFYSSPFARAKETAMACLNGLLNSTTTNDEFIFEVQRDIVIEDGLMERYVHSR